MAIADTALLAKVRSRYFTLAFSAVLMGGWLLTWTLARKPIAPYAGPIRQWVVFAGALPMLFVLCCTSLYAAALARNAAAGAPGAAHTGWRLGRVIYGLFAVTIVVLLLLSLGELVTAGSPRPGTIIGLLGAGLWGGWYLSVMRDQINLFGQAAGPPAAPGSEQGSAAEP